MTIVAALIFNFCLWAVFSRKFNDGIFVKHLLIFSAITAILSMRDPGNTSAFLTSVALLSLGMIGWLVKRYCKICALDRRYYRTGR